MSYLYFEGGILSTECVCLSLALSNQRMDGSCVQVPNWDSGHMSWQPEALFRKEGVKQSQQSKWQTV